MRAEEVIQAVAELCRHFSAVEVILFGSRAKGTARERSDIDVAVSGVKDFDALAEAKQRDLSDSFVLVEPVQNLASHLIWHGKL